METSFINEDKEEPSTDNYQTQINKVFSVSQAIIVVVCHLPHNGTPSLWKYDLGFST